MASTSGAAQRRTRRWLGLSVLMLPVLLVTVDNTVLGFALPKIAAALRPSASQQLWMIDAYSLVLAGCWCRWVVWGIESVIVSCCWPGPWVCDCVGANRVFRYRHAADCRASLYGRFRCNADAFNVGVDTFGVRGPRGAQTGSRDLGNDVDGRLGTRSFGGWGVAGIFQLGVDFPVGGARVGAIAGVGTTVVARIRARCFRTVGSYEHPAIDVRSWCHCLWHQTQRQ